MDSNGRKKYNLNVLSPDVVPLLEQFSLSQEDIKVLESVGEIGQYSYDGRKKSAADVWGEVKNALSAVIVGDVYNNDLSWGYIPNELLKGSYPIYMVYYSNFIAFYCHAFNRTYCYLYDQLDINFNNISDEKMVGYGTEFKRTIKGDPVKGAVAGAVIAGTAGAVIGASITGKDRVETKQYGGILKIRDSSLTISFPDGSCLFNDHFSLYDFNVYNEYRKMYTASRYRSVYSYLYAQAKIYMESNNVEMATKYFEILSQYNYKDSVELYNSCKKDTEEKNKGWRKKQDRQGMVAIIIASILWVIFLLLCYRYR